MLSRMGFEERKANVCILCTAISIVGFSGYAVASETEDDEGLEVNDRSPIVTRILAKPDLTLSPTAVIDGAAIDGSGRATIGELLQRLPLSANGINVQFNRGGDGTTRVNLRGFGAPRTLVLRRGPLRQSAIGPSPSSRSLVYERPCDTAFGRSDNAQVNCRNDNIPDTLVTGRTNDRAVVGGNQDLEPETADMFTAGIVLGAQVHGICSRLHADRRLLQSQYRQSNRAVGRSDHSR